MRQLFAFVVGAVALAALNPAPVRAQGLATTTFVSGFGLDTNPCTVAAPCRSFQHAHNMTAAGGQITMLDPAGYGTVTITKAISIVNDGGGEAGINDPGAGNDAITINAGATDVVTLRGLTLNGVGTGRNGITFLGGFKLNVQDCVIRDFTAAGLFAQPVTATSFIITDTIVSDNATGIEVSPTEGTASLFFSRVAAVGNTADGFFLGGGAGQVRGTIVDSVATGNGPGASGNGFFVSLGSIITLIDSKATGNGVGLNATGSSAHVRISQVTLVDNTGHGFVVASSATVQSFGDNYLIDTNNSGSLDTGCPLPLRC